MGLVLNHVGRAPERIEVYGAEGAGKTYGYFCIAAKTNGTMYVLDTDLTVDAFLDGERFGDLAPRFEVHQPLEFGDAVEQAEKWLAELEEQGYSLSNLSPHWLVVDRLDWAWDAAQEEFSERIFGSDIDEHFLAYRQKMEDMKRQDQKGSKSPFDGLVDWPTIKKRHQRLIKVILRWPGHVYVTAAEKEVVQGLDDSDTFRQYGQIGARPAGEKKNGHAMRTVLRFQGNNPQTWRLTTVKDREREQLSGVFISDFAMDYLKKVARWKPGVG